MEKVEDHRGPQKTKYRHIAVRDGSRRVTEETHGIEERKENISVVST